MKFLQRTEVQQFKIENAVKLEGLGEKNIIPLEKLCEKYEKVDLNERKRELFLNGVRLTFKKPDGLYQVWCEKCFVGLGVINNELLKRDVIVKED